MNARSDSPCWDAVVEFTDSSAAAQVISQALVHSVINLQFWSMVKMRDVHERGGEVKVVSVCPAFAPAVYSPTNFVTTSS